MYLLHMTHSFNTFIVKHPKCVFIEQGMQCFAAIIAKTFSVGSFTLFSWRLYGKDTKKWK